MLSMSKHTFDVNYTLLSSLFCYSCLKLKTLLQKSICIEKSACLELRGFVHLGKDFKNCLGVIFNIQRQIFLCLMVSE